MRFFKPTTAKGESINSLIFWLFKFNWVWPLDYESHWFNLFIVNCLALIFLSCCFVTIYAEYLYINANQGDINKVAQCLCGFIFGILVIIKILHLVFQREQMRRILNTFYTEIYIHKSENETLNKECKRSLRLVYFMSSTFFLTTFSQFLSLGIAIATDPTSNSKPYLVNMQFPYDAQEPWKYAFTIMYTGWAAFSVVSITSAEDCLIGTTLSNCTVRYKMLNEDLSNLYENTLKSPRIQNKSKLETNQNNELHKIFHNKLSAIIRKQQVLDSFLQDLQSFLSLPIFVVVLFGIFLLCTVAFQLQKNGISVDTLEYFFWLLAQCLEFFVIGTFGQRSTDAAAEMSNSYYMCNWESLLAYGDVMDNVKLIRNISFLVFRAQKSVHLDGMGFMILSLDSIGNAMSSSVSYFMFLSTMENISNEEN
ncbi:odorant receptor 13a-like [Episyrphus balteatus]|uniref:odorant receptor 13a-like n=1 Tax=Episyrphus balteatus TaxID=286459 RepID=UPI002485E552|nr:odorant receptor 13a-like [Episyrphus balteatus]